jgi:hypothetical protein
MIKVSITPSDTSLADLISGLEMVSAKFLPNTVRAVKVSVAILEYTWKCYAMGAPIYGTNVRIRSIRGAYAKSIHKTSARLSGTVWSDSPYAAAIEEGTDEKDLKKIIPLGPKSRMGENGPYSIVPFRHGTPKSLSAPMPQQVYSKIRQLIKKKEFERSKVLKPIYETPNAAGKMVERHTYNWGSRASVHGFPDLEGMVAFNVSSGERETRGGYITFRVITLNKPKNPKSAKGWEGSWIVPARQGLHLTKYVVANTREIIGEVVRAGMVRDLIP